MCTGQRQLGCDVDPVGALRLSVDRRPFIGQRLNRAQTLASGERIEIRGFGSFSLHYREPRIGRNPKTGESVGLSGKHVPHFKPGKELRERVNASMALFPAAAASNDDDADVEPTAPGVAGIGSEG